MEVREGGAWEYGWSIRIGGVLCLGKTTLAPSLVIARPGWFMSQESGSWHSLSVPSEPCLSLPLALSLSSVRRKGGMSHQPVLALVFSRGHMLLCKHALCSRSFSHTDARVQGILPPRDWGLCLLTGFPSEFQVSEEMVTALATNLDWCILGTCALWEEFSDLT